MLWVVCAGLMKELVSETEEQTMPFGEDTVTTRCLAMFATPMRERTATDRGWLVADSALLLTLNFQKLDNWRASFYTHKWKDTPAFKSINPNNNVKM